MLTIYLRLNVLAASDSGGPRKEFLELYLREAQLRMIHDRELQYHEDTLENRDYYVLGLIMGRLGSLGGCSIMLVMYLFDT